MIEYSFIENEQRHYVLRRGTQPNHSFLSLLNATFFIGISTIYWPHSIVFRILREHQCLIWKENCHRVLFSKICSKPIFSVWSFDHWKAMVRLLSYKDVALNRFLLFAEHFFPKYRRSTDSFRASLGANGVFLFLRSCETSTSWWTW